MTHDEKVLALLSDGQPHTHHEIYALHVVGHSRVASLRAKGYRIAQWREGDDYLYLLTATPDEALQDGLYALSESALVREAAQPSSASSGTAATAEPSPAWSATVEHVPDQLALVIA